MAINFPSSPTLNQTFTSGNTTYQWDGSSWEVVYILSNPNGLSISTPNGLTTGSGLTGGTFNGSAPVTIAIDTSTVTTLTGTQTLTNKTLTSSTLNSPTLNSAITNTIFTLGGSIDEKIYDVIDGAGVALSPQNGTIQTWTLGASRTPTSGTWNAGESMALMINDGSAYTINWTTLNVIWVGGTAPTLDTTKYTVIELWKVGAQIYGALVGAA